MAGFSLCCCLQAMDGALSQWKGLETAPPNTVKNSIYKYVRFTLCCLCSVTSCGAPLQYAATPDKPVCMVQRA